MACAASGTGLQVVMAVAPSRDGAATVATVVTAVAACCDEVATVVTVTAVAVCWDEVATMATAAAASCDSAATVATVATLAAAATMTALLVGAFCCLYAVKMLSPDKLMHCGEWQAKMVEGKEGF